MSRRHKAERPGRRALMLGYEINGDDKRRTAPGSSLKSEDTALTTTGRRKGISRVRDLWRTFTAARWMVNKHLDFVASVGFQSRCSQVIGAKTPAAKAELAALDDRIEALVDWWSRPLNFDVRRRHGLYRSLRIAEACRVSDGDMAFQKLSSGKVAAIEGDLIRTPTTGIPPEHAQTKWTEGLQLSPAGAMEAACVCDRGNYANSFVFKAVIPAAFLVHHAWWDFRFDQVRGISPFLAAANDLVDVKEAKVYALAKMKISQMVGLITKREGDENLGEPSGGGDTESDKPFTVDMGKAPFLLDFGPTDDAKWLESNTPSTAFKDFWQLVLAGGLKALDLPWSFWDEAYTNFFGSRAALNLYLASANRKRADVAETASTLLRWRLAIFIADGVLVLPRYLALPELAFDWIPTGLPWWNPVQEVKADIMALDACLTTGQDILRPQGKDFFDTVDARAEELAYAEEKLGRFRPKPPEPLPQPGADDNADPPQ